MHGPKVGILAVVGRGRLGNALAAALETAGCDVHGPLGRGADGGNADIVLLCVPESSIADAARHVSPRPGRLVGHCSASSTLEPLAPHEAFSIHPLMTVTAEGAIFDGAACAVAGSTPRALAIAGLLARTLGMEPFEVAERDRALYHAAATMASNYLIALEGVAERLAARAGVRREQLVPLVRAAADNWARLGARVALTGPIARGDEGTAMRQRSAVAERAPDILPLWDALGSATRILAREPDPT